MPNIEVLDQNTINKIAAGEVIERPSAVVKELVENAIDAKSNAITVEIKDGGTTFIRITDNGYGIEKQDISKAFLRHSTSKIKAVEDLLNVSSLGFRGEALSSIAAVSQVELVTKTPRELMGIRYLIEGGSEKNIENIGCPEGTTFIVRNLFYNTPARRKFLKSNTTEAGYINDLIERMALSHPDVSFKFINNNQIKLHTSGNGNLKDIIYNIYGRDIASNLLDINAVSENVKIYGFIGKPVITRGNRNYENYYINGRYIKSAIINKAIEEAYKSYSMIHRYPFTTLHFSITSELIDVNVHPAKMEIRFRNGEEIYDLVYNTIKNALSHKELIPDVKLTEEKNSVVKKYNSVPEPFEKKRKEYESLKKDFSLPKPVSVLKETDSYVVEKKNEETELTKIPKEEVKKNPSVPDTDINIKKENYKSVQIELFEDKLISEESKPKHRILGQLFGTYWVLEYSDKMFLVDQHAAHEKILYEKTMNALKNKEFLSQMVNPPIIISLNMREEEVLKENISYLNHLGFEIESFGGKEYAIRSVPGDMLGIAQKELFIELLDSLVEDNKIKDTDIILERVASLSCKAAVKGNSRMSLEEADELMTRLLKLDNPYNCPHGRPVIISMSKYEIEKKFKRIV